MFKKLSMTVFVLCLFFTLAVGCGMVVAGAQKPWVKLTPEEVLNRQLDIQLANAARKGEVNKIRELVSQGANVNAQGLHGISVLSLALYKENLPGVKELLANGANPNQYAENGRAPIHFACGVIKNPAFLAEILKAQGDPNLDIQQGGLSGKPLHESLLDDNRSLEKISLLLDAGADINGVDATGKTALMSAAFANQFDAINLLLDRGADPTVKDKYGHSIKDVVQSVLSSPGATRHKEQLKWQKIVKERLSLIE